MRRKVVVTVSAMIVAAQLGSPLAAAQPTVELERLLEGEFGFGGWVGHEGLRTKSG